MTTTVFSASALVNGALMNGTPIMKKLQVERWPSQSILHQTVPNLLCFPCRIPICCLHSCDYGFSTLLQMCSARHNFCRTTRQSFLVAKAVNGYESPRIEGHNGASTYERSALIWFKRDLRTDDHPGLVAASSYSKVIPLYIFDPILLAGWSAELVDALRDAVLDLKRSLLTIGCDLVIRIGGTQDVLLAIAQEVECLDIFTEVEVEMESHQLIRSVSSSLLDESIDGSGTFVKEWRSAMYEIEDFTDLPACHKTFQKRSYSMLHPVDAPTSLPSLSSSFERGYLPSLEEILTAISTKKSKDLTWLSFKSAQETPAEVLLGAKRQSERILASTAPQKTAGRGVFKKLVAWRDRHLLAGPKSALDMKRRDRVSVLVESKVFVLEGGATGALNALKGYLRFFEPTGRADWQELHKYILSLEQPPGDSFRTLFGNALALGTLSIRRIYHEAIEYEKDRGGGLLSPFAFSTTTGAAAAIRDSKSIEWYQLLALKTREQGRDQGFQVGTWRWRGYLVQYALAGETGPPVLFVHGFGAFWQHWRDNINSVAESGHRVFALTMLGFGRSEKPSITYSDLVWGELVRDFIVEVVRDPVIIAGNSIGGYTASVVAGLWPSLVKSLVLLNSAGRVVPDYKELTYNEPREKSAVADVGARLLLAYLQNLSDGMLIKCYPTNPWRADRWLQEEVKRASYDPNSTAVLKAMFHLRAPLPLNYYLDRYNGDILIIQGMRDPLHDSSKRASMLQAYCKNVSIQYVNAGHCPHDEVPEEVNGILTTWLKEKWSLQAIFSATAKPANGIARATSTKEPSNDVLASSKSEIEELVWIQK